MFWSANYIVVRELNILLKEENVSLTQVLEADDILQECKADNKALLQFLTRPEILAELITLITEEPPSNELASQYRHASIACEVLTSHLSTLSDRLSMDTVQMHRLCDFINQEPPLNPLLASYFSKTVEMLLERSPKQDWYFYHIVCLRVLDFFKSRRDFLPNLLRHLATSAIADTFKYFIRLDDLDNLFNKIVMEWLEEHQFLDSLIQIMCGTYVPEPLTPRAEPDNTHAHTHAGKEKGESEHSEKDVNNKEDGSSSEDEVKVGTDHGASDGAPDGSEASHQNLKRRLRASKDTHEDLEVTQLARNVQPDEASARAAAQRAAERMQAVASANAAALLCDLLLTGCAGDGSSTRPRTGWVLASRLVEEDTVRAVLGAVFTAAGSARTAALVNGCQLLRALLDHHPLMRAEWSSVEVALAPHLPLLHQALLHDPDHAPDPCVWGAGAGAGAGAACARRRVGRARVQVAALLAQLALSQVHEVPTTMLTLGTAGALLSMFFSYADNNFLHAQVLAFVKHALDNPSYGQHYAEHLFVECDLLTRLMDAYEENEARKSDSIPRAGYMGHVVSLLGVCGRAIDSRPDQAWPALQRWQHFAENTLRPVLARHDTPLGGSYPSDNIYEFNDMMTTGLDDMNEDNMNNDMCTSLGGGEANDLDNMESADNEDKNERMMCNMPVSNNFGDDMWDEVEPDIVDRAVQDMFCDVSPWESTGGEASLGAAGGEGWAQFDAFADNRDTFADASQHARDAFWTTHHTDGDQRGTEKNMPKINDNQSDLLANQDQSLEQSSVELTNNLLNAMSSMALDDIAKIVNAKISRDRLDSDTTEITATVNPTDIETANDDKSISHTDNPTNLPDSSSDFEKTSTIEDKSNDPSTNLSDNASSYTENSQNESTTDSTEPSTQSES